MGKRIVVVGSNVAGLTVALELAERLAGRHRVIVISKTEQFVFMPSLVWVPFGMRTVKEISFPLVPVYRRAGVELHISPVTRIDLASRRVYTARSMHAYDYLVIATGPKLDYAAIPGLGPRDGFTQSIFSPRDAERTGEALRRFFARPGPALVGTVQGASFFGAAYEFAFLLARRIEKHGLERGASVTFVTAEPSLGHFGLGGVAGVTSFAERLMRERGIAVETGAAFRSIGPHGAELADGRTVPFEFAMLTPPFVGVDAVRACTDIVDDAGFVEVNDYYQTAAYPEVFAAGVAVSLGPATDTGLGVPKTGYLAEQMARVVAENVVASIEGRALRALPPEEIDAKYVLDAGGTGVLVTADRYLEPGDASRVVPGPEAHWAKIGFEKYFLATRSRGLL